MEFLATDPLSSADLDRSRRTCIGLSPVQSTTISPGGLRYWRRSKMRYRTTIALLAQSSSRDLLSQAWEDKVKVKFAWRLRIWYDISMLSLRLPNKCHRLRWLEKMWFLSLTRLYPNKAWRIGRGCEKSLSLPLVRLCIDT